MRYPRFTGTEPCTEIGPGAYTEDPEGGFIPGRAVMVAACLSCHTYTACREWAVRHEAYGFWAGMSANDRRKERSRRGIVLDDPIHVLSPTYGERRAG